MSVATILIWSILSGTLVSGKWMAFFWIWACLLSSLTHRREDFPTVWMHRLICGWTSVGELSAEIVVNEYSEKELFHIIRDYGEDRFAKNIAKNIVIEREKEPIRTTGRLAGIVSYSIPMKIKKQGGHPAKRTFRAIRIEVNHELEVLEKTISDMIDLLNPEGRICIITFHSLEDRIVKQAFRQAQNPCTCPPDFPVCVCGNKPKGKQVTRKPILPSEEEMEQNPRSKSAKLRIFQRI